MKIHHEVISIHPERKTVSVKNLENGEIFEENYDKLILSPGAKPTQPRLPGVGMDKLFTLRTVEDTFRIKEYINKNHPKSAVLAGGGFIGDRKEEAGQAKAGKCISEVSPPRD